MATQKLPDSLVNHLRGAHPSLNIRDDSLSFLATGSLAAEVVATQCFRCGCHVNKEQIVDTGCFAAFMEDDSESYLQILKTFKRMSDDALKLAPILSDLKFLQSERDTSNNLQVSRSQTSSPRRDLILSERPQTSQGRQAAHSPSLSGRCTPIHSQLFSSHSASSLA